MRQGFAWGHGLGSPQPCYPCVLFSYVLWIFDHSRGQNSYSWPRASPRFSQGFPRLFLGLSEPRFLGIYIVKIRPTLTAEASKPPLPSPLFMNHRTFKKYLFDPCVDGPSNNYSTLHRWLFTSIFSLGYKSSSIISIEQEYARNSNTWNILLRCCSQRARHSSASMDGSVHSSSLGTPLNTQHQQLQAKNKSNRLDFDVYSWSRDKHVRS